MGSTQIDRITGLSSSAAIKVPVRVASAGVDFSTYLTSGGLPTMDGVQLDALDRVLLKDQSDAIQNGVYIANTSPWIRAQDFQNNSDLCQGTLVYVAEGTADGGQLFQLTSANPVNIGVLAITFAETSTSENATAITYENPFASPQSSQSVAARLSRDFSVEDAGALTTAADNTAAFQSAVDTGLDIYVPSGVYVVNGPVILTTPNQTISGPGTVKTPVTWNATANATPQFGTRPQVFWLTAAATNVTFDGLRIDGSATTSITGTATKQPGFISSLGLKTSILNMRMSALPLMLSPLPESGQMVLFAADGGLVSGSVFNGEANNNLPAATFGGGAIFTQANEQTVTGNQFFNFNDAVVCKDTLTSTETYGLAVTGNLFDGGTYGAQSHLSALEVVSGSFGVTFSGNYVRSISSSVYINSFISGQATSIGLTVTGNIFDMGGGANYAFDDNNPDQQQGDNLYGVTIADNQFINLVGGSGYRYLNLGGSGYNIHDNLFNVGDGCAGIEIYPLSGVVSMVDAAVHDNKFLLNDAAAVTVGIDVASTTTIARWSFANNTFIGNGAQTNVGIRDSGATLFQAELRGNVAYSQTGSANFGNLYAGTPWGTFAYNALPKAHYLNNNVNFGGLSVVPGTAAPSSGTWAVGDTAPNTAPSELGTTGSKYTISGWVNTVAGTPGTWLAQRALTGN